MATTTAGRAPTTSDTRAPRILAPGLLLGLGLGGFIDGIVLHQILQWHHMLTDYGRYSAFPATNVSDLEDNNLADGLFHASTWLFIAVGLFWLWRALNRPHRPFDVRALIGLLLAGWGIFNIVEGVIDHHILTVHHVRDDVSEPLLWDLGFLVLGAALLILGTTLYRSVGREGEARWTSSTSSPTT
jgi:uncharacterized membrane protein